MTDWTWIAKRWLAASTLWALETRPGLWAASWLFRARHPRLAAAAGEELVARPRRVLAFTAHPDDLELFAGGTLRRLALAGSYITAAVLSDGEKRGRDLPDLGGVRRAEQQAAAQILGYQQVRFFGLPDFGLPEDPRLEPTVARIWEEEAPEVVLAFDPKELFPGFANRDHKALGRTVMDLSRHHFGRCRVYFYGTRHPNVLVDIGPVLPDKEAAVLSLASQMLYLTDEGHRRALRLWAAACAAGSGCQLAEPLYRLM